MIKKINIIPIVALLLLAGTGCKKDYLDINQTNPNQTTKPPLNGLLAAVTYQTGLNVYRTGYFTSNYVQYLSSSNESSGSDIYDELDRSSLWYNVYHAIEDARNMQEKAAEQNAIHHIGVAQVTEAMNMSLIIDVFGDVPYSEAWNPENYFPAYDNAENVFNASLALLDDAIENFNNADVGVELDATNDVVHGGDAEAWKKTAFALKARLLNRLSKTSSYDPAAILSAVDSAYSSNGDDAQVTQFVARSVWNQIAYNNTVLLLDGWLSTQFVEALDGTTFGVEDPRLPLIATLTQFGDYRGTENGAGRIGTGTDDEESYLSVDGFYSKAGAPLLLVTYSELKFIEAEAALAAGDEDRAYAAYIDGISANMDKVGVSASAKAAYLAQPSVKASAATLTKALIFKEKYVAMFLHPEAWTDARRFDYGYEDFTLPQNAVLDTYIRRQAYPNTETSRNAANVPDVASLADKLWWDQ